jgi:hypothetical protein
MAARTASSGSGSELQQVLLVMRQFVVRNDVARVAAKAGIDAVNYLALRQLALERRPPLFDARHEGCVRSQRNRAAQARDGDDLVQRKVFVRKANNRGGNAQRGHCMPINTTVMWCLR